MPAKQPSSDITLLLHQLRNNEPGAADRVLSVVYPELRRIARSFMQRERGNHTLQPTALIHEAWMRLVDQTRVDWRDRSHFMGVAAGMMRRVLVDHARLRLAGKRGLGQTPISLEDTDVAELRGKPEEILAVHQALERLAAIDPRQAKIAELRYFGGLEVDETATALGISPRTVDREWSMARAWLQVQLRRKGGG